MPPSGKRRGRKETNDSQVAAANVPDSSPSRPAKRRKRANEDAKSSSQSKSQTSKEAPETDGNDLDTQATADRVATILDMPDKEVQVLKDHGNDKQASALGIQAYAKIAGRDWTYYVRDLRTQIGRAPEAVYPGRTNEEGSGEERGLLAAETEASRIHIDLGPDKLISRQHAEIYFNSDGEDWFIIVNGRNPIKVDQTQVHKGQQVRLRCGSVIGIGHVQMLFILPDQPLVINAHWLLKAGIAVPSDDNDVESHTPEATIPGRAYPAGPGGPSYSIPIAPAPPDYRRGSTPIQRRGPFYSTTPGGNSYGTNTLIMATTDQIDLSLDENSAIKPTYSYSQLISQAILDTDEKCATLNKIYEHITKNYAYYRKPEKMSNWQNSIRHNLSLSKCFHKIPRSFKEPGKGMNWTILPEFMEEMSQSCRRLGRGGHRGPSAPASPAVGKGPRSNIPTDGTLDESPNSMERLKRSPRSPPLSSYPMSAQHTPDQRLHPQPSNHAHDVLPGDGSPLPRHRRQNGGTYGLSDNVQGSPPTLSSSYIPEEGASLITPAPHRVQPRLMPPSTAQRPSQHMLTSSPAPFWKYIDDKDGTPLRTPFAGIAGLGPENSSPIKGLGIPERPAMQSSSPPASRVGETGSPTRNQTLPSSSLNVSVGKETTDAEDDEEAVGIDLTRGFQSISTFHSKANNSVSANSRS